MWTNPEIWPRVLLLNRGLFILLLTFGGFLSALGKLPAQDTGRTAFLLRGPFERSGLVFLAPNTLLVYTAWYILEQEEIEVTFTRAPIYIPDSWTVERCEFLLLHRVAGEERLSLSYQDEKGYALFFSFEREDGGWCTFVRQFIKRFRLLLGFAKEPGDIPFPAILEISQ